MNPTPRLTNTRHHLAIAHVAAAEAQRKRRSATDLDDGLIAHLLVGGNGAQWLALGGVSPAGVREAAATLARRRLQGLGDGLDALDQERSAITARLDLGNVLSRRVPRAMTPRWSTYLKSLTSGTSPVDSARLLVEDASGCVAELLAEAGVDAKALAQQPQSFGHERDQRRPGRGTREVFVAAPPQQARNALNAPEIFAQIGDFTFDVRECPGGSIVAVTSRWYTNRSAGASRLRDAVAAVQVRLMERHAWWQDIRIAVACTDSASVPHP